MSSALLFQLGKEFFGLYHIITILYSSPHVFRNGFCSKIQPTEEIFWMVFHVANFVSVALTASVEIVICSTVQQSEKFWIVFYIAYVLWVSSPNQARRFLSCIPQCIFSFGGPYQVCSGMSSPQFSSRAGSFGFILNCICSSGVLTTCAQECRLLKCSPGRGVFGLYSTLYIFFGRPLPSVFRNVVCSTF
jgi:hypothetical protein